MKCRRGQGATSACKEGEAVTRGCTKLNQLAPMLCCCAELAFNICFSIEMLLRVVSMGSLLGYIRRPWNQFDSVSAGVAACPLGAVTGLGSAFS